MIIMHTEYLIRLTHMYVCVCVCVCVYIYTHTHTHTYIPHCYNYYRPYYDNTYGLINIKV